MCCLLRGSIKLLFTSSWNCNSLNFVFILGTRGRTHWLFHSWTFWACHYWGSQPIEQIKFVFRCPLSHSSGEGTVFALYNALLYSTWFNSSWQPSYLNKDAIFQRLAEDRLYNQLPCILITAKGYPDIATRFRTSNPLHYIVDYTSYSYWSNLSFNVLKQVYLASTEPDFSKYANICISGLVKPFLMLFLWMEALSNVNMYNIMVVCFLDKVRFLLNSGTLQGSLYCVLTNMEAYQWAWNHTDTVFLWMIKAWSSPYFQNDINDILQFQLAM